MAGNSSGRYIPYSIRHAKQTERLLILDCLRLAEGLGYPGSGYRYVGMGAAHYYDFRLLHRMLGINQMINLEQDAKFQARVAHNKPFGFIRIKNMSSSSFLAYDERTSTPDVYWFDYDGGLAKTQIGDIVSVSDRAAPGDFLFVTVPGVPSGKMQEMGSVARFEHLEEMFDDLTGELTVEMCSNKNFPWAILAILRGAFRNAFSFKPFSFVPLMQVTYRDSLLMCSYGGMIVEKAERGALVEAHRRELPFLAHCLEERPFDIRDLNLTEYELELFDLAATSRRKSRAMNQLLAMGFHEADIRHYRTLMRYAPKYVERLV